MKYFPRNTIARILRSRGKQAFLKQLDATPIILDVGCGNNSPKRTKEVLPQAYYVGLDIGDYNNSTETLSFADEYVLCEPNVFASEITKLGSRFDAVISSHNIEHCDDREATLLAMAQSLKPSGSIFMSFPCEASVSFPKRSGTLNYYDDATHKFEPPSSIRVRQLLESEGVKIVYLNERYRPFILMLIGFFMEPLSMLKKRALIGTWALYGFETIIWGRKN